MVFAALVVQNRGATVAAMTYLLRHKSGTYHFRRAVPAGLKKIIGKTAIKQSLRTKDVTEAKRRAHPLAIKADAEFQAARKRLAAPPRSELTPAEIEHLADAYLHQRLAEDDAARIKGSKEGDDLCRQINTWLRTTASMF